MSEEITPQAVDPAAPIEGEATAGQNVTANSAPVADPAASELQDAMNLGFQSVDAYREVRANASAAGYDKPSEFIRDAQIILQASNDVAALEQHIANLRYRDDLPEDFKAQEIARYEQTLNATRQQGGELVTGLHGRFIDRLKTDLQARGKTLDGNMERILRATDLAVLPQAVTSMRAQLGLTPSNSPAPTKGEIREAIPLEFVNGQWVEGKAAARTGSPAAETVPANWRDAVAGSYFSPSTGTGEAPTGANVQTAAPPPVAAAAPRVAAQAATPTQSRNWHSASYFDLMNSGG